MHQDFIDGLDLDDFISFEELRDDYPDTTPSVWRELATGANIPVLRMRVEVPGKRVRKTAVGLRLSDIAVIEEAYRTPRADDSIISANKLAIELRVGQETLENEAERNGIASFVYDFGKGPNGVGFNEEQSDELRAIFAKRKEKIAGDEIHSSISVRKKFGIGAEKLEALLAELKITQGEYIFGKAFGFGITSEELARLEAHVDSQTVKKAPNNVRSLNKVAVENSMSGKTLAELARGAGVVLKTYLFRGHEGAGLADEEVEKIRDAYAAFNDESARPVSLKSFSRENRIAPEVLLELVRSVGVEPQTYRFGKKYGLGITVAEIAKIEDAFSAFTAIKAVEVPTQPAPLTI